MLPALHLVRPKAHFSPATIVHLHDGHDDSGAPRLHRRAHGLQRCAGAGPDAGVPRSRLAVQEHRRDGRPPLPVLREPVGLDDAGGRAGRLGAVLLLACATGCGVLSVAT